MIKDLIAKNKYLFDISEASKLQYEQSFYITIDAKNPFYNDFKLRVSNLYNKTTHRVNRFFTAFLGKSIPTIEVCETIFSDLYRVFDSQDQNSNYEFKDSEVKKDGLEYLSKTEKFWRKEYWEAIKYRFNSFLVIDLPAEPTLKPEPYINVIDINRVVYIDLNEDLSVKEIIFREEKDKKEFYYYYTDRFYSKYELVGDVETEIFTHPHKLGKCPVVFLWPDRLNNTHILRKGVLTPNYDDLFWYVVKVIESRKSDLLYLNPTMQRPKRNCGYNGKEHVSGKSGTCNGGYLYNGETPIIENGSLVLCPACGEKTHAGEGAGNYIEIDLNSAAIRDGKVNPSLPLASFITPPIEGTVKQHEWIIEMKEHIIKSVCGEDKLLASESVNKDQVKMSYESKENIYKRIASNISEIRQFVDWCILKLRYDEAFISNSFFLGSEFYLKSESDLLKLRKDSYDPIQKKQIDEQIIEVKFRNSPKKLERERLLYKLLPYSGITDSEFIAGIGKIVTDQKIIDLRLQFTDCVTMFESSLGSIYDFYLSMSEKLTEQDKIITIKNQLYSYVQNQIPGSIASEQGTN